MPQVVPVGIGNYDFTVVSFSESTQLNTLIAQVANLTTITAKEATLALVKTQTDKMQFNAQNHIASNVHQLQAGAITDIQNGIAKTTELNSAVTSIKGANNKDITQVFNNTPTIDNAGVATAVRTELTPELALINTNLDTKVSEIAVGWNPYISAMPSMQNGIEAINKKIESKGEEVIKVVNKIKIPEQKEPIVNVTTEKIDTTEFIKAIKEIKPEVNVKTETVNVDFKPVMDKI